MVEIRGVFREVMAFGPDFSNQVWSTICVAMVCPRIRPSLGVARWMSAGKNPSILEKWWADRFGVVLNCLLVKEASSNAVRTPIIVTVRAASLRRGGIVMMGVLKGIMFEVIRRPATMLPQASRLMGLITAGLFSLIGDRELNRGWPIETKKTTRRL